MTKDPDELSELMDAIESAVEEKFGPDVRWSMFIFGPSNNLGMIGNVDPDFVFTTVDQIRTSSGH